MPTEARYEQIRIEDCVIGRGQVRLSEVQKEVDELAANIRVQGLLEPIIVCPSDDQPGKYEVLAGQRRLLACTSIGWPTIDAVIRARPADEFDAKALSLSENLLRRDPVRADLIDACTDLYRKYGSIPDVVARTGLPDRLVREYVKFDRLAAPLQQLVKEHGIDIKTALRAQDAASVTGTLDVEEAKKLATAMSGMSGAQQQKVVKERKQKPTSDADDVIESAKSGGRIVQVLVTLGAEAHAALKEYAKSENTSMDDAARSLIEEGLSTRGFEEDGE